MTHPAAELLTAWNAELNGRPGTYSLALRSERVRVGRQEHLPHYAASTMKLAVLGALLTDAPAGALTVHTEFPSAAGGTFELQQVDDQDDWTWAQVGHHVDLSILTERMITVSSNLATNLVLERIRIDAVDRFLTDHGLADEIQVRRLIGDVAAERQGISNTVTAAGLADLMTGLTTGDTVGSRRAISLLAGQTHLDMIPAGLPPGTWSASKGGWVAGVKHDVATVRPPVAPPYVLAVCTTADLPDPDGTALVARLSVVTWEHWNRWHAS